MSKMVYDKSTQAVIRLGIALVRAIKEHGAPNSFGFSELVGRDAMVAGKAVRKQWIAFCLNVSSRLPDGVSINLSGGRLHVETRKGTAAYKELGGRP